MEMFEKGICYPFQRVICPLTEEEEFAKYSGMGGLLEFYREECGLVVYNRAIPDFKIPTSGDLVNNILDLTYHLSKVLLQRYSSSLLLGFKDEDFGNSLACGPLL